MNQKDILRKVPIDGLYTRLTGQDFARVNGAYRAKNIFRDDSNPSMTLRAKSNTLIDYAESKTYNHFDLLSMSGSVVSFEEQLRFLAEIAGITLTESDMKSAKIEGEARASLIRFKMIAKQTLRTRFNNPEFQKFIADHELPNDIDFFDTLDLGMAPMWDEVKQLPRIKTILKMSKQDYSEFSESGAVIYPLHDASNVLTSFRMRAINQKQIRTLKIEENDIGFYGRSFLQAGKSSSNIIVVEGENNLLSLASVFYGEPDFKSQLAMVAIGPSTESDRIMYNLSRLGDAFYIINDNDPAGEKVVDAFYKFGSQIIQIVDWPEGTPDKYDIEDHLRGKPDKIEAYSQLGTFLSYPEWAAKRISKAMKEELNEKLKARRVEEMSGEMSVLFKTQVDKDEFSSIVKQKFDVDISSHVRNTSKTQDGFEIKNNTYVFTDPSDDTAPPKHISNFIVDVDCELIILSGGSRVSGRELSGTVIKENGSSSSMRFPVDYLADTQKLISSLRNSAGYELATKHGFGSVLPKLIQELNDPKEVYVFDALGAPIEDEEKSREFFGTEHVIVYPEMSVVGGKVVNNERVNFKVNTTEWMEKIKFANPDIEEQKILIDFFLNRMMGGIYKDDPISWMVMGFSIFSILKTHLYGYPLLYGSTLVVHGKTGNRKTTTVRFAQNFWGSYAEDGDLGSFIDTGNSQKYILSKHGHLTYAYDEYKPAEKNEIDLGSLIHQVASGRDKRRLKSQIELRPSLSIKCNVLLTTEQLTDISASQNARCLPLRMPPIDRSEDYGEVNNWSVQKQHRLTAPIAAWINQLPSGAVKAFKEAYSLTFEGIELSANAERISTSYAKCIAGTWILTEFGRKMGVIDSDRQDKILDAVRKYSDIAKLEHVNRVEGTSLFDKIINGIHEIIQEGMIGVAFIDLDRPDREWKKPQYQSIGVSFWHKKGVVSMAFHETSMVSSLNKYLPDAGFSSESIRAELFESGVIASNQTPVSTSHYWPDSTNFVKGRVQKINVTEKIPDLGMYILNSFK